MIDFWLVLLGWQLVGTAIAHALGWPIPGPVIGMVGLTLQLLWRAPGAEDEARAGTLIQYLPVLFVPACTGVVQYLGLLQAVWWQVLIALAISTALSVSATAWVFCRLARASAPPLDEERRA